MSEGKSQGPPPKAESERPEEIPASRQVTSGDHGVSVGGNVYGDVTIYPPPAPAAPLPLAVPPKIATTRLTHVAEELFGREIDLARLDAAWESPGIHVVALVAWGGVGKTSLVAKWAAGKDLGGADYFDWSFYSQGTKEQSAATGEPFVNEALRFFGGEEGEKLAESPVSAWNKGSKLAEFVARRRALLVLDGLEPLQYPASSPLAGQLKDPGLEALLKGIAGSNPGLCVVTTREKIAEHLNAYRGTRFLEWTLDRLSTTAGVALLRKLGVIGTQKELEELVEEMDGHALTLDVLGSYLHEAYEGDVRKLDLVELEEANRERQNGHAFRAIATYENWLGGENAAGERQLAILRLLGLFDRPADPGCIAALRRDPVILGLTDPLVGISDAQWNLAVTKLAYRKLLSKRDDGALDAHPLVREYFAKQLRERHEEVWRDAHSRLFEHLRDSTKHWPDTLEGLQPLYQAVAHGCLAGRYEEARAGIYRDRVLRGTGADGFFSWRKLGAFGSNLGALAYFFETPWFSTVSLLSETAQFWLLNEASIQLQALGRLTEAADPIRATLKANERKGEWKNAAAAASNLIRLELDRGELLAAMSEAQRCVTLADRSADPFLRIVVRSTLADSLHQLGRRKEAEALFVEAETLQSKRENGFPRLYSFQGFRYCVLLLGEAERAAARGESREGFTAGLVEVEERARQALGWATVYGAPLDRAVGHLILGRLALYQSVLEGTIADAARPDIEKSVDLLRNAHHLTHLPKGLLTRAWLRFAEGDETGSRADLAAVKEIASRGPMPLYLADVALYRGRMFKDREALSEARRLIEKHGYGRRLGELEDAEASI